MKKEYQHKLDERLFEFVIRTINFLKSIKNSQELSVIKYQLSKSATSSGANYEEAQAASSLNDFSSKINISLREMRESNYWLRICDSLNIGNKDELDFILKESEELKRILGSISTKARNKKSN